jgi:hypothetical protein
LSFLIGVWGSAGHFDVHTFYLVLVLKELKGEKMERRIIVFVLSLMMFLVQGCVTVTSYKFAPEVLSGQKVDEQQGAKRIVSNKKAGAVYVRSVKDMYTQDDYPEIEVGVFSEKSFDFSPDDIKVFVDGNPHKVLTLDEVVAEIKERYTAGVETIKKRNDEKIRQMVDSSKKNPNDPAVFSPSALDSANVPGQSYQSQYKYDFKSIGASNQQAASAAEAEIRVLKEETEKNLKTILSAYHVKATVPANKWYPGEVKLAKLADPSKPHDIKVIVKAVGEEHEFLIKSVSK